MVSLWSSPIRVLERDDRLADQATPAIESVGLGDGTTLPIQARLVAAVLGSAVAFLLALHILGATATHVLERPSVYGLVPRFDLNSEANVPAWFASTILFVASLLFGAITWVKRSRSEQYVRHWAGLWLMFVYMSADEGGQIHELLIEPSRSLLGDASGWLRFAWTVPASILVTIISLAYLRFLRHLPAQSARGFVLAAGLFLGGALGMEVIGGWYLSNAGENFRYALLTGIEETLEKLGVVLLIYTQLRYLAEESSVIRLTVRHDHTGQARDRLTRQLPANP